MRGLARLNNGKQHEQLTISLGDGRICAYRVISSYTPVPRPFVPLLRPPLLPRSCTARSRTSPVLSRFLFYTIEDTFLLFRVLFYVIEDVLFPYSTFYLNIEDGDCMCMCICMCVHPCRWILSAGLSRFFSLSFRERVTPSLSLHKRNEPAPSKTRLLFGYYTLTFSFVTTTLRAASFAFFSRFVGRVHSMFLTSRPPFEWL